MKCPNCNTENDDGSTLCAQCQTPLPKVEQAAQPASPADQTVYPSTQPAYLSVSPPPPPPPPKRSNAVTILLIVVVSVLIIGSAVGLVYYKSQTATQNANATSTA